MPTAQPTDPTNGIAGYSVTPASQNVGNGLLATFRISLDGGRLANQPLFFDISDTSPSGGSLTYPSGSNPAIINNGSNFVDFQCSHQSVAQYGDTYTISVRPRAGATDGTLTGPVTATLIIGYDYDVTPTSQSVQAGVAAPLAITLRNNAVAPAGGLSFGLATSASSGGSFSSGASVLLAAGQNSVPTNYTGTSVETDTITVTPPSGGVINPAAKTAQVTITAPPPPPASPAFTFGPASQNATTGQASGLLTLALANGALAATDLTFGLTTDEQTGGSFSTGTSATILAGHNSATCTYLSTNDGTFHLTATPPVSGVSGAAQTVTVTFASSPPPPPPSIDYSLALSLNGMASVPTDLQIDLQAGAVAPRDGYSFALSSSQDGTFDANPLVMPEGTSRISTPYTGNTPVYPDAPVAHVLSAVGAAPLVTTGHTATITLSAAAPQAPGFVFGPASQNAVTGQASGLLTLALAGGALAASDLPFALSTDENSGGSFSSGANATILNGHNNVTLSYTSTKDGTFHLTATPPSGVQGDSQIVAVTFSTPRVLPPVLSGRELDVRLYHRDGTRKTMPQGWLDSISFELSEKGGMQNGTMQLLAKWEDIQFKGDEYVDVRLWGQFVYRGFLRQPQNEVGTPERSSPTLMGCMDLLNGYQCLRDFVYSPGVDIRQVFTDLCAHTLKAGREPTVIVADPNIQFLGITVKQFSAKGKSMAQAMNALVELAPGELIWGCDVDETTLANRIYLRPRVTPIKYHFRVGANVSGYVRTAYVTKVVNRIFVTGGKLSQQYAAQTLPANLAPNASFEDVGVFGEDDGNVLRNPSFDEDDSLTGWNHPGVVIAKNFGRTGTNAAELNNDNAPHEYVSQDIPVAGGLAHVYASCYWNKRQEFTANNQIRFDLLHNGAIVATSLQDPQLMATDLNGYTYHRYAYDWAVGYFGSYDTLRVSYILASESQNGYAGQTLIDDCAVWFAYAGQQGGPAKSWRISVGNKGAFANVDWQNTDIVAFDGATCVKLTAVVTGNAANSAANYAEISTTIADRPQGQPRRAYCVVFRVRQADGQSLALQCQAGARIYSQSKVKATRLGTALNFVPGQWTAIPVFFGSGNDCDAVEPFLRFLTSGTYYVDAAALYLDCDAVPTLYSPDDTFRAVRSTKDYAATGLLSAGAATSITDWGESEQAVSNDNVIDQATLDAFAVGYFNANAVPPLESKVTIKGAQKEDLVRIDGYARVVNLPVAPPPLPIVRVHYQIGSSVDIETDLATEPPEQALLLREVTLGKA